MYYHVFYNSEDEYLAHSLKGLARKIHKYLLRIKTSKGYRYFYSKAEIDAYMKKLKGKDHSDVSESEEQKKSSNKNARIRELLKEQKERDKNNQEVAKKAIAASKQEIQKITTEREHEVAKKAVAVSKKKLNEIATEREHEVAFKNYAFVGNIESEIQSKASTYSRPTSEKVDDATKARANVVSKAQKQMDDLQKKIKDGSISSGMAALSARAIQDEMEFNLDHIDHEAKRNNGANLKQYLK